MILPKSEKVPLETTGGLQTVAIRYPAHPIAQKLIELSGGFIAAPSANTSGKPSPTIAKYVIEDMDGKIDMIIDGGEVGIGLESTIIDLTTKEPVILRPGFITEGMLQEIVSNITLDQALADNDQKLIPKAPGMKYRHYAPKAQMTIINGEELEVVAYINQQVEKYKKQQVKTGVIATQDTLKLYKADSVKNIGSKQNAEEIAKHLFKILREFDDEDIEMIFTESFSYDGIGQAIMNRLIKAAGNHVINLNEGGYANDSNRK